MTNPPNTDIPTNTSTSTSTSTTVSDERKPDTQIQLQQDTQIQQNGEPERFLDHTKNRIIVAVAGGPMGVLVALFEGESMEEALEFGAGFSVFWLALWGWVAVSARKQKAQQKSELSTLQPQKYVSDRYELSHDGTIVHDKKTGLMWQRGFSDEKMDHAHAQEYTKNLRLGGFSDWRLPTRAELNGLLTQEKNSRGYYQDEVFDDRRGKRFTCWTSTESVGNFITRLFGKSAWVANFGSGLDSNRVLRLRCNVRAVRTQSVVK